MAGTHAVEVRSVFEGMTVFLLHSTAARFMGVTGLTGFARFAGFTGLCRVCPI